MHGSQRRDRRGSTSNMNGHAHASPTQAADLADYLPPYSEDMRQTRRYDIVGLLARSARKLLAKTAIVHGATQKSFAQLSRDLGMTNADGYLTIVDRKKDMIISGGENVASRDVEEVLYSHPAVAEVAVFGVPRESWIEAVAAAVLFKEGERATTDELIVFVRERLAPFKCPKYIVEMDALPKNPNGKILKRELRDQYSDLPADLDEAKG
jgi:acyl-coenzyme A synthetase/AMP-(fatty) acid ligase